jgi:hypothetical protein
MRPRLLLLLALGLAACGPTPDTPAPADPDDEAAPPLDRPSGPLDVPGATPAGEEPGVPGSDRPERAWPIGEGACFAYERYVVRVRPRAAAPGEDVLVFARTGDARARCDAPAGDAAFAATDADRAAYFFGLVGDLLLLDEGTGPNGRTVRLVALPSGATVHEAVYEEPIEIADGALLYGMEAEVVASMDEMRALGVSCPEAATWFEEGLGVGLSPQVRYDLATRTAAPTGEVLCVPIQ